MTELKQTYDFLHKDLIIIPMDISLKKMIELGININIEQNEKRMNLFIDRDFILSGHHTCSKVR